MCNNNTISWQKLNDFWFSDNLIFCFFKDVSGAIQIYNSDCDCVCVCDNNVNNNNSNKSMIKIINTNVESMKLLSQTAVSIDSKIYAFVTDGKRFRTSCSNL